MEKRQARGIPSLGAVRKAQAVVAAPAVATHAVVMPGAAILAVVTRVAVAPAPGAVSRVPGRSSAHHAQVAGRSVNHAARKIGAKPPGLSGKGKLLSKITAPRARRNTKARGLPKT